MQSTRRNTKLLQRRLHKADWYLSRSRWMTRASAPVWYERRKTERGAVPQPIHSPYASSLPVGWPGLLATGGTEPGYIGVGRRWAGAAAPRSLPSSDFGLSSRSKRLFRSWPACTTAAAI